MAPRSSSERPSSADYIESLMAAGQGVVQQIERALDIQQARMAWPFQLPEQIMHAAELQRSYLEQIGAAWINVFLGGSGTEQRSDPRFKDEAWRDQPYYSLLKQLYLIGAKFLHDLVEEAQVDERTKLQMRFYARQYTDALSPSNFPATNPEVIKRALETRSKSLANGLKNLMEDIGKGRITMTDKSAFEIGRNIAATPGSVVFENELIQLIHYHATTTEVEKTPLLIVPPCINKYYVLDMQPANSFVRHAVERSHDVYLISWRSADRSIESCTWDDYLELGIRQAVDVVCEITGEDKTHALGFCVGGTLLGCAAAVMAGAGDNRLASLTLLTTMLDFTDTGEIGIMVDPPYVGAREATIGQGGILPGSELAFAFSTLRANDLIWSYVVNNYLKGATPDAFDLLYWNSDSVNLPGPMYCWYVRNAYLENKIAMPGKTVQCGVPVDLSRIGIPAYLFAAHEDHIVPWKSAYRSRALLSGPTKFVLGASGHIAGVVSPPSRNKRSYRTGDGPADTPEAWLEAAREVPGSWWSDWDGWLKQQSHGRRAAPAVPNSAKHPAVESAPGSYVKARAAC